VHVLRYPPGTLIGDYIRAGVGVGVGAAVLLSTPIGWVIGIVFGGMVVLFGTFGLRTIQRHMSRIVVTPEGIASKALGVRKIHWDALQQVKLRYYGTKRQERRESGFLQLKLRGDGTTMTFESNVEGFDLIVWCAARAARANEAEIDATSAGNMAALGIDADGTGPPPPQVADMADDLMKDAAEMERRQSAK
jgi:hypothetical protein